MKKLLALTAIALGVQATSVSLYSQPLGSTSSISQYGITWTFSSPVEHGKFVNGDYYVVLGSSSVDLISISPKPENGSNGFMVNPISGAKHTYDSRATNYDAASVRALPMRLTTNASIVSTRSTTSADLSASDSYSQTWLGHTVSSSHSMLMDAAVLTVLSAHPPTGTFRPPYIGTAKPLINAASIDRTKLPMLSGPTSTPSTALTERALERPWIIHGRDWTARLIHPVNNMPNYHREVADVLSEASLLLTTSKYSETLLIRYLQLGIDYYYMATTGSVGDSSFFEAPVIIAGALLNNSAMKNLFVDRRHTTGPRGSMYYFGNETLSKIGSTLVSAGTTWTGSNVFFRKQSGDTEHEHLHPSEWAKVANGGGLKNENYRTSVDCHPSIGMTLATAIFKLSASYGNDAVLAYADRWMTEDYATKFLPEVRKFYPTASAGSTRDAGSAFANAMWSSYRNIGDQAAGVTVPAVAPMNAAISITQF